MNRYVLRYESRPWTLNIERQGNRWKRAELVREWRQMFNILARNAKIPPMKAIRVIAQPELKNRASMPDTGACIGAVKASVDGLIDARVLRDDGPDVVRELIFKAPIVTGKDALVLTIEDLSG